MPLQEAFSIADEILRQGIMGISEIIAKPGLINVDFADVRSVMQDAGPALMGIGTGSGKSRARDAAVAAISSPLLDFPIEKAKGVVFTITGNSGMSLQEVRPARVRALLALGPQQGSRRTTRRRPRAQHRRPACCDPRSPASLLRSASTLCVCFPFAAQVNEVAAVISEIVADDANIIFGTSVDESFQDEISVTVVATSFGELW